MGSLDGLFVLDCSHLVAGPSAAQMLGDMGAEVVKVESPQGDEVRRLGAVKLGGESAGWLAHNRNKRCMVLDLKQPRGGEVMDRLVERADVIVLSHRPGVADRLGLTYERLSRLNPRLIYCSITAFGETGPSHQRPGVDILLQAESGLMAINGEADGPPLRIGLTIVDVLAGLWATQALLAALYVRERTGRGQRIDLSLFDVAIATQSYPLTEFLISGIPPRRSGNTAPLGVPAGVYQTKDQPLVLSSYIPAMWEQLCQLLDLPDLASEFPSNEVRIRHRAKVDARLQERLLLRTADEWIALLAPAGIVCGRVQNYPALVHDPQVAHNAMLGNVVHPDLGAVPYVADPPRLSLTPYAVRRPPGRRGEHTAEILAEAGYNAGEIEALRREEVVA